MEELCPLIGKVGRPVMCVPHRSPLLAWAAMLAAGWSSRPLAADCQRMAGVCAAGHLPARFPHPASALGAPLCQYGPVALIIWRRPGSRG